MENSKKEREGEEGYRKREERRCICKVRDLRRQMSTTQGFESQSSQRERKTPSISFPSKGLSYRGATGKHT